MENEVFLLLPQKRKASQWDASVCQKSIILIFTLRAAARIK